MEVDFGIVMNNNDIIHSLVLISVPQSSCITLAMTVDKVNVIGFAASFFWFVSGPVRNWLDNWSSEITAMKHNMANMATVIRTLVEYPFTFALLYFNPSWVFDSYESPAIAGKKNVESSQ